MHAMANRQEKIPRDLDSVPSFIIDFVIEHGQMTSVLLWFLKSSFKCGNTSLPVFFLGGCSRDKNLPFKFVHSATYSRIQIKRVFKILALIPVGSDNTTLKHALSTAFLGKACFPKQN